MLENPTTSLLAGVLDAVSENHSLIAENIANSNTKGYRAKHVDFDLLLQDLKSSVINDELYQRPNNFYQAITDIQKTSIPIQESNMQGIALDQEMAALSKNVLRYQALLSARSELGSLMSIAIKGR